MDNINSVISGVKGALLQLKEDGFDYVPAKPIEYKFDLPDSVIQAETTANVVRSKEERRADLLAVYKEVQKCAKCRELALGRNKIVFGGGNADADLMFVGEAPGRDEDIQGLPFVGKAGQLLTKMLAAIGLSREDVFIANVLKCRPPQNRNPLPDEIMNCHEYLLKQIDLVQPKIICALGSFAIHTLLQTNDSISKLRGKIHDYHGTKLVATYHPAYLLRSPGEKKKSWEDLQMIQRELGK